MEVYCVMELTDREYGCRDVESIWATYEKAQEHIDKLGNDVINLWDDRELDLYIIQEYQVQGIEE